MKTMYVIRWKSMVNGRAGKGTKLFARVEGEQLIEELNREYPQIHHELAEVGHDAGPENMPESGMKSFATEPMELASTE